MVEAESREQNSVQSEHKPEANPLDHCEGLAEDCYIDDELQHQTELAEDAHSVHSEVPNCVQAGDLCNHHQP